MVDLQESGGKKERNFKCISIQATLYMQVHNFLTAHPSLGYRSLAEFTSQSLRREIERIQTMYEGDRIKKILDEQLRLEKSVERFSQLLENAMKETGILPEGHLTPTTIEAKLDPELQRILTMIKKESNNKSETIRRFREEMNKRLEEAERETKTQ